MSSILLIQRVVNFTVKVTVEMYNCIFFSTLTMAQLKCNLKCCLQNNVGGLWLASLMVNGMQNTLCVTIVQEGKVPINKSDKKKTNSNV